MTPGREMPSDRLRPAIRRRIAIVALIAAIIGIGVGLVVLGLWQHSTANTVKVVQRNSRCNSGDLAACRIVAENLRRACTPRILSRVPAKHRARERRRCGVLALRASSQNSTRSRARARRTSSSSSSPSTTSSPGSRTPGARTPTHQPVSQPRPPATTGPSTPPAAAPSSPSTSPAAPSQPPPLIQIPDGLPCVPVAQLIGC